MNAQHRSGQSSRWFALCVALATIVGLALPGPSTARADDGASDGEEAEKKVKAQALVHAATELYNAEKYERALPLFQQAYELYASPKIVMNTGSTLARLGRLAEAANTYQTFLSLPGRNRNVDSEVKAIIKRDLAPRLGRLDIEIIGASSRRVVIYVDGARVERDTRASGQSGAIAVAGAIWAAPGKREIRAEGSDFSAEPVEVRARAGKVARVTLIGRPTSAPEKEPKPQKEPEKTPDARPPLEPVAAPSDTESRPGTGYRIATWVGLALTAASLTGAVVSHSSIGSSEDDLQQAITAYQNASADQLDVNDACSDARGTMAPSGSESLLTAVIESCDDGEQAAQRANIFYGATAALGALTVFMFYKGYISAPDAEPTGQTARISTQPTFSPTTVGAELIIRF